MATCLRASSFSHSFIWRMMFTRSAIMMRITRLSLIHIWYRIVKARWAGKSQGTQYPITLRVVGHDDIGIVTNITSIISKETGITLRSIGIDSHDGLFSGTLTRCV